MKNIRKINETTAIAFAVEDERGVRRVILHTGEEIHLIEYRDTLLNFINEEECDRFVDGYNRELNRPCSLMTENNFLRDIDLYCFFYGITVNPINGERIDQTKGSYRGAREFGSYYN